MQDILQENSTQSSYSFECADQRIFAHLGSKTILNLRCATDPFRSSVSAVMRLPAPTLSVSTSAYHFKKYTFRQHKPNIQCPWPNNWFPLPRCLAYRDLNLCKIQNRVRVGARRKFLHFFYFKAEYKWIMQKSDQESRRRWTEELFHVAPVSWNISLRPADLISLIIFLRWCLHVI